MIRDEDLKSSIDYSEGQKEAAHRILIELVNVFKEYEEDIRIVGGWVPAVSYTHLDVYKRQALIWFRTV